MFLAALAEGHTVRLSAELAGWTWDAAYKTRHRHPDFAADWDEALEQGVQVLEQEARRRAVDGTDKPVFQGGEKVGSIREYSDTLLIFLLKSKRPNVYREQVKHDVDHHQPDGPIRNVFEIVYTHTRADLPT